MVKKRAKRACGVAKRKKVIKTTYKRKKRATSRKKSLIDKIVKMFK